MPERAWWLAGGLATAITLAAGAEAPAETAIGEPVERHGIEVGAAYLDAIEMDPAPAVPMGDDVIHLECDVAATADNAHGFPEGAWVPYLTCAYEIEKVGAAWRDVGVMLPMTAQDGPHYANNVPLDGAGEYRVTYHVSPPSVRGFYRHADDATGVAPWWQPFEVSWTFDYRAGD